MRALLWSFALASVLGASVATAQPSDDVKTAARSLLDEGDRRLQQNDVAGALDAYIKADALMRVPTTTIEVARTQARLGRLIAARDSARAVLAFPEQSPEPQPFTVARKEAGELIASLERRIPSVVVVVSGPSPGSVALSIDGSLRDPHATHAVDPGKHEILVSAAGYVDSRRSLDIAEGARIKLALAMVAPDTPYAPIMATGGVIAGIGLVFGVAFGVVSWTKTVDIEERCNDGKCDPALANDISDAEAFANVSNVGFGFVGAGAIVVAVGLGLYLTDDKSAPVRATASGLAIDF